MSAGQSNGELSEIADLAIDGDRAAMLLGHDVVADREAEAGAFTSRLGREERLKKPVSVVGRDAGAVVTDADFNGVAEIPRRYLQSGLELGVVPLPLALVGGVEAIAEKVQTD